jgi:hypothetical protein
VLRLLSYPKTAEILLVITAVDHHPMKTTDDLWKALEARRRDKVVLLLVQSAQGSRFVVIRVESQ